MAIVSTPIIHDLCFIPEGISVMSQKKRTLPFALQTLNYTAISSGMHNIVYWVCLHKQRKYVKITGCNQMHKTRNSCYESQNEVIKRFKGKLMGNNIIRKILAFKLYQLRRKKKVQNARNDTPHLTLSTKHPGPAVAYTGIWIGGDRSIQTKKQ